MGRAKGLKDEETKRRGTKRLKDEEDLATAESANRRRSRRWPLGKRVAAVTNKTRGEETKRRRDGGKLVRERNYGSQRTREIDSG